MTKCLSDMQIAMLVAGRASAALRRRLGEHLLVCGRCREIVVEAVKDERETSLTPHAGEDPSKGTVARDRALIEGVLEGISGTLRTTVGCGPTRCIVPLQFRGHAGDAATLAAKEAVNEAGQESETPVAECASADERYQVTFHRAGDAGGFRAIVKRPSRETPMPARLAFPALDLSFPLDADGTTPVMALEGILLESCRVDVEIDDSGTSG